MMMMMMMMPSIEYIDCDIHNTLSSIITSNDIKKVIHLKARKAQPLNGSNVFKLIIVKNN